MTADPEQGPATRTVGISIGEPGEGLDELQGLYAADASSREQLPEQGEEPFFTTSGPASPAAATITPPLGPVAGAGGTND